MQMLNVFCMHMVVSKLTAHRLPATVRSHRCRPDIKRSQAVHNNATHGVSLLLGLDKRPGYGLAALFECLDSFDARRRCSVAVAVALHAGTALRRALHWLLRLSELAARDVIYNRLQLLRSTFLPRGGFSSRLLV